MKIWIDAQMSPAIAAWINQHYEVEAIAVRELGLREAEDRDIFFAAKREAAVVMTKDSDFLVLLGATWPTSASNYEAPHIHVEQAERFAEFWLNPLSLVKSRGFRKGKLSGLIRYHYAGELASSVKFSK